MISISEIQQAVSAQFGTPLMEMKSHRRSQYVARPRQVAMYLARELTPLSLPAIGRHFGDRDHTTVMHAIWRVEGLSAVDAEFAGVVATLRKRLTPAE